MFFKLKEIIKPFKKYWLFVNKIIMKNSWLFNELNLIHNLLFWWGCFRKCKRIWILHTILALRIFKWFFLLLKLLFEPIISSFFCQFRQLKCLVAKQPLQMTSSVRPLENYQCTFLIDTFVMYYYFFFVPASCIAKIICQANSVLLWLAV